MNRNKRIAILLILVSATLLLACQQQSKPPKDQAVDYVKSSYPQLECQSLSVLTLDEGITRVEMRTNLLGGTVDFQVMVNGKSISDTLLDKLSQMLSEEITAHLEHEYGIGPYQLGIKLLPDASAALSMTSSATKSGGLEYQVVISPKGEVSDDLIAKAGIEEGPYYASMILAPNGASPGFFSPGGEISRGEQVQVGRITFDPAMDPEIPLVLVTGRNGKGYVPFSCLSKQLPKPWTVIKEVITEETVLYTLPQHGVIATRRPAGVVARVLDRQGDWSCIEVRIWEAYEQNRGWVLTSHLAAFDPALSKEAVLAAGARIYFGQHPSFPGRDGQYDYTATAPQYVTTSEIKDGYLHIYAPGGVDGWVKPEAVISKDPWEFWPD